MNIRPPSGDRPQRIDSPRTGAAPEARPVERDETAPAAEAPGIDRVELSPEARQLESALRAQNLSLTQLAPERLRQVLDRIASGHYDRPEVIDQTVRQIASELSDPPVQE